MGIEALLILGLIAFGVWNVKRKMRRVGRTVRAACDTGPGRGLLWLAASRWLR